LRPYFSPAQFCFSAASYFSAIYLVPQARRIVIGVVLLVLAAIAKDRIDRDMTLF
jgi:hypothetical protein